MSYKIRITKPAQNDISQIYKYILEDLKNPQAADGRIDLINHAIQSLEENPARHALVRDDYLSSKGFRMMVVKSHLVFYIIREEIKTISIMRVLYGRRNWARILGGKRD